MFSVAAVAFYLGVTPMGWHPAFGFLGGSGLMGVILWIIVVGGILTGIVRLRRAARGVQSRES